jgi:hypothetical protein
MVQRENKNYTVFYMRIMNHSYGEPPDQVFYAWHMIIDIRIALVDSKCYHNKFIKPSVSMILHHCQLALISWHSKEETNSPYTLGAVWNFVDQSIKQTHTLDYNGAPNTPTRFVLGYSEAAFIDGTTFSSPLKRKHNTLTYQHIKELIALKITGYNLINEKLNPVDKISKQWKHRMIWNHMKSLLFCSGDSNDLMKPAEEWGEKVKNIVGCNKFNISTTTYRFQPITSALERSTPIDSFQLFDQCNPINIDPDMTILASMIAPQFRGRILLHCEKCNNSTTNHLFQSVRSELERSTPVDSL